MKRQIWALPSLMTLSLALLAAGQARAEFAEYRFSGVLPDSVNITGDMIGKVSAGDSWTANIEVDLDSPDSNSDSKIGSYDDMTLKAEIVFSSGYKDSFLPGAIDSLNINDDQNGYDKIDLLMWDMNNSGRVLWVIVATTDLSALSSDDLPTFPTSFVQSTTQSESVLTYYSEGRAGWVEYSSTNNGRFEVVPEPSTLAMFSLFGIISGFIAWRKRKRA